MFKDERIEKLEGEIKRLRDMVYVYTDQGEIPVSTMLYHLLKHLNIRLTTTQPVTKFEEIPNDETQA